MNEIRGFFAIERRVASLERSIDFYVRGLGFEVAQAPVGTGTRGDGILRLGTERLALIALEDAEARVPRVGGPDVRFQHAAIVTRDMDAALERLNLLAPEAITQRGPQRLPSASGGGCAFKFRDPDGHPLELIEFAPGRVPARWRGHAGHAPTLGIDHSAISVSQVERSIDFYRGLGFSVGTRQINRGAAQARLDGLDAVGADVELEVVALLPGGAPGPHLELLAYHTPRPVPLGLPAADPLVADGTADRLLWVGLPAGASSNDPDGHRHALVAALP